MVSGPASCNVLEFLAVDFTLAVKSKLFCLESYALLSCETNGFVSILGLNCCDKFLRKVLVILCKFSKGAIFFVCVCIRCFTYLRIKSLSIYGSLGVRSPTISLDINRFTKSRMVATPTLPTFASSDTLNIVSLGFAFT